MAVAVLESPFSPYLGDTLDGLDTQTSPADGLNSIVIVIDGTAVAI